ncbi:MAG: hypothetical protein OXE76_15430 [Alphaproteobacteria bacterium]|nr:hypothetical protein [Alphaproteobacteria bacterium]
MTVYLFLEDSDYPTFDKGRKVLVGEIRNGRNTSIDSVENQSEGNVQEAVDLLIDSTLEILEDSGGNAVREDREPLLRDLINLFEERVAENGTDSEAEDAEGIGVRLRTLRAARDRAVERYERETGQTWRRPGG